jgi:pimeloyl-ACP methyl ester carboxylesterase
VKRRTTLVAGGVAAAAVAAVVVPRLVERRLMGAHDHHADDPVSIPPDALHHHLELADGGELHVVERGPIGARPLVLLHGITLAAATWGYQLRDLAGPFRVIAPDLRGHGESRPGAAGHGIGPIASDLAELLVQLDLRDAIVVGHSMGGMALQRAAQDHLDVLEARAAGLVFLSTSPGPTVPAAVRDSLDRLAARLNGVGQTTAWKRAGGLPKGPAGTFATTLAFGRDPSASHVLATKGWLHAMEPQSTWATGLSLSTHSGLAGLQAWSGPALVIVGSRDLITPVRFARLIQRELRDSHLEVLPGCGHMAMLERHDELGALLEAFAARLPVRAGS